MTMETNLKDIENQLKNTVVENAPFPIGVYLGRDMKIALANKAMVRTMGKGDDIIGRSYFDVLPELSTQGIFEKLLEVLSTGTPYEVKNSRVDLVINGIGTTHFFNYAFTPIFDATGTVYGVMNTGTDVTDLNIARQQTLEAEEKLSLAITTAELGTYEIDMTNDRVSVSDNFRKLWGIGEEAVTKETILARVHPDDMALRDTAWAASAHDGTVAYEVRVIHNDNSTRWIRINGTIIRNDRHEPITLVGIAQDITQQKTSVEQLAEIIDQRTAQLMRSNDDLMHFSHIVSHDLKEPVRKIRIFNSLLSQAPDKKQRDEYSEKINTAAIRMSSLIEGILTYSSTNALGFPVETADLNTILQGIKKDLELLIDEKQAIFVEQQLPAVQGSMILLQRLLYNLVSNALKFSRAEEPPRVTISFTTFLKEDQDTIRITIEDNGIGIQPEYAEKIFNAFERLHPKDKYEGTGLGLALCRKITERHAGTVSAKSHPGGALFIVELPLKQQQHFV